MAKLPSFTSATSAQDDLLTKGFCFDNHFGLSFADSSSKDITYKASVNAAKTEGVSSIKTSARFEERFESGLLLKLSLAAMNQVKANFEYSPPENSNVKLSSEVSSEISTTDSIDASLSTEFVSDRLRAKIGVFTGPKFKLAWVFGEEKAGAGIDLEFDALASRFTKYNWLIYWSHASNHIALKHFGSDAVAYTLGPVKVSYFTNLTASTNIAAELRLGAKSAEPQVQFGLQHVFSSNLTGKVRLNELGGVATSFSHKLSENAHLTTSSSLNFSQGIAWPLLNLGFKIKLSS